VLEHVARGAEGSKVSTDGLNGYNPIGQYLVHAMW